MESTTTVVPAAPGLPRVEILLSTFNGARFLSALLDSLLAQTCTDWRLIVRDDGSSDETLEILRRFVARCPDKIRLLDTGGNLGAMRSFETLCRASTAPFVMFCDQDDVWLPRKVELSLAVLLRAGARYGSNVPMVGFSDLMVTDAGLNVIHRSFFRYSGRSPRNAVLPKLLLRNVAPGCAMIANRTLLLKALPFPDEAIMHDYWLILVAALLGRVLHIRFPTVLYRLHEKNVLGVEPTCGVGIRRAWGRLRKAWVLRHKGYYPDRRYLQQAKALFNRFANEIPARRRALLDEFISLPTVSPKRRKAFLLRHRIFPYDLVGNLELLLGI